MYVCIPQDTWLALEQDRRSPDGRIFSGRPPPTGIYPASWIRQFVRTHHDLPIAWPDDGWMWVNGEASRTNQHYLPPERPMVRRAWTFAPHAVQLLKARGVADGEPPGVILRRLLVQHFGRTPSAPVRVTGGAHMLTPGQGADCPSCGYDRETMGGQ